MSKSDTEDPGPRGWAMDALIPTSAKASPEGLRSARDALALCVCAALAHALMAALYWSQGMAAAALGALGAAGALALCPLALRARSGARKAALGMELTFYGFYVLTAVRFGGPDAPGLSSLLLCPMVAFLISGPSSATRWMLWCLASVAALLVAQQMGATFQAPSAQERRFLSLGAMGAQFSLTLIALWRYQAKKTLSQGGIPERRKNSGKGANR